MFGVCFFAETMLIPHAYLHARILHLVRFRFEYYLQLLHGRPTKVSDNRWSKQRAEDKAMVALLSCRKCALRC